MTYHVQQARLTCCLLITILNLIFLLNRSCNHHRKELLDLIHQAQVHLDVYRFGFTSQCIFASKDVCKCGQNCRYELLDYLLIIVMLETQYFLFSIPELVTCRNFTVLCLSIERIAGRCMKYHWYTNKQPRILNVCNAVATM